MSKAKKVWLIVALSLLVAGVIILCISLASLHFDMSRLSTVKCVDETYCFEDEINSVDIDVGMANVKFRLSDDGKTTVMCHIFENEELDVHVEDGVLRVHSTESGFVFMAFDILDEPTITVYLPQDRLEAVKVRTDTGCITLPSHLSCESIDVSSDIGDIECRAKVSGNAVLATDVGEIYISGTDYTSISVDVGTGNVLIEGCSVSDIIAETSTGDITMSDVKVIGKFSVESSTGTIKLTDVNCMHLGAKCSTGGIIMKNVYAAIDIEAKNSTGDISLEDCYASGSMDLSTSAGDIKGSLSHEMIIHASSKCGDVNVDSASRGGECKANTGVGSIDIIILSRDVPQ